MGEKRKKTKHIKQLHLVISSVVAIVRLHVRYKHSEMHSVQAATYPRGRMQGKINQKHLKH